MLPLALLPIELVLAGFVAAQSSSGCQDGYGDKLNNKYGQDPCNVRTQINQACKDSAGNSSCLCNTVVFSVNAACEACQGQGIPDWDRWAGNNACGSSPEEFPPHLQTQFTQGTIPNWAYHQLTSDNDFDIVSAVDSSSKDRGLSTGAQVGIAFAVGICLAVVAALLLRWYWRRKFRRHRDPRQKSLPLLPGQSPLLAPWRWLKDKAGIGSSRRSFRLQPTKKNSGWAIDDDVELLPSHSGGGAYQGNGYTPGLGGNMYTDPYAPQDPPSSSRAELRSISGGSGHMKQASNATSSSTPSFLSRLTDVRAPSFMERFIKFKDGIRKSSSYAVKYVSPTSPDPQFRIDGSEPSPIRPSYPNRMAGAHTTTDFRARPPSLVLERAIPAGRPVTEPGAPLGDVVEVPEDWEDLGEEPVPGRDAPGSVLLISRDGGDFTDDDTTTMGGHLGTPRHPLSPQTPSTTRQPPSAYSTRMASSRSGSGTGSRTGTSTGTGSWLPSPRRANTSSTVSGAYPHELRADPELTSPRSWANKFPVPPQTFTGPTSAQTYAGAGAGSAALVPPLPPVPATVGATGGRGWVQSESPKQLSPDYNTRTF